MLSTGKADYNGTRPSSVVTTDSRAQEYTSCARPGARNACGNILFQVFSGVPGWPLVGRQEELYHLTGTVAAKRGAVITGPAGVGKTTLALNGVEWAEQRGMVQRRVSATKASQGLPFGAFASLMLPEGSYSERPSLGH